MAYAFLIIAGILTIVGMSVAVIYAKSPNEGRFDRIQTDRFALGLGIMVGGIFIGLLAAVWIWAESPDGLLDIIRKLTEPNR